MTYSTARSEAAYLAAQEVIAGGVNSGARSGRALPNRCFPPACPRGQAGIMDEAPSRTRSGRRITVDESVRRGHEGIRAQWYSA